MALGSASVRPGFFVVRLEEPVQADQVDSALGEEPGVVGEVLGTAFVLHAGGDGPEPDRRAVAADEADSCPPRGG